jgi:hypothetical protein
MSDEIKRTGMLAPELTLLVKLGSIAVHTDEMLSSDGHVFDRVALQSLLTDPEVVAWLKKMDAAAMVPKRRKAQP